MDVKIIIIYFKKKIFLNIFFIEINMLFFLSILVSISYDFSDFSLFILSIFFKCSFERRLNIPKIYFELLTLVSLL